MEHRAHQRRREAALQTKHIQAREDWPLRAIKLQLLQPQLFEQLRHCVFTTATGRGTAQNYFNYLHNGGVLRGIGVGDPTQYRQQLLCKAVKAHHKEMQRAHQQATKPVETA